MLILRNQLLETFEKVVNAGTAHAAAIELNITQTAVTQRIKALETGLSMTLFLRSRRGMTMTDEGKTLLQLCRRYRELEGEYLSQLQNDGKPSIQLTLVGPTSAISTRVPDDVRLLYAKHPFLRLHLRSEDHTNIIAMIKRGEADLGIVPPSQVPLEMDSKKIKSDRYLLVGSPKWKGRKLTDILRTERMIDFYESDPTTSKYLSCFELTEGNRSERLFVNENDALIRLFREGVGYGTLTESIAGRYIESGELLALNRGQSLEDPLALVWFPRPKRMPYFDDLIRSIR